MSWFELFFFATLFELAGALDPRPLNTVRLYIAVYCHKVFAVEELFFAPAVIDEFQLVLNNMRGGKRQKSVPSELPILRQLFLHFATLLPAFDVGCLVCWSLAIHFLKHWWWLRGLNLSELILKHFLIYTDVALMNIHRPLLKLSRKGCCGKSMNERIEQGKTKEIVKAFCVHTFDISRQLKSNLITVSTRFIGLIISLELTLMKSDG